VHDIILQCIQLKIKSLDTHNNVRLEKICELTNLFHSIYFTMNAVGTSGVQNIKKRISKNMFDMFVH